MDFSQLRLGTLFNPQTFNGPFAKRRKELDEQQIASQDIPPDEQPLDITTEMQKLYQPQHTADDMFMEALRNMPQRQQPNMLNKIAAVLSGAATGGPVGIAAGSPIGYRAGSPEDQQRAVNNALYPNYDREMQDWKTGIIPKQQAADNERQSNINQRVLANDIVGRKLTDNRQAETERNNRARQDAIDKKNMTDADLRQQQIDINRQKMDIAKFQAEHQAWKPFIDEDGVVVYANPNDPKAAPIRTGIKTGKWSDEDKAEYGRDTDLMKIRENNKAAMDRVNAQQAGANNRNAASIAGANDRNTNTQTHIDNRVGGNIKPPTPTAVNRDLLNRAQQIYNTRTDLQPYMEIINGKPTGNIKNPSTGVFGMGADKSGKADELRKLLYPTQSTEPKATEVTADKRKIGQIYILGNGTRGKWDGKAFDAVK